MGKFSPRATAGTAILAAVSAVCTACAPAEPDRTPLAIGIDATSPEQIVLGEIYNEIFTVLGFAVSVTDASDRPAQDPVEQLRTEELDLTIACTGSLLEERDPQGAQALAREASEADSEAADLSVATYDAVVGTFPADVRSVDPSPAQGCGGGEGELPRNIIPLVVKGKLDRWATYRLNFITRVMATEDIAEMAQRVRDGEPAEEATRDWLLEYAGITYDGDVIAPSQPKTAPGV